MSALATASYTVTGVWDFLFKKQSTVTALANDGTPTVLSKNVFQTGGTTTITDFDDGVVGQQLFIQAKHTIEITHNASNIVLSGGVKFDMVAGDSLTLFMFEAGIWTEIGRGNNS